jgi:hypothetical protein
MNRQFAVYRIHLQSARISPIYILLYCTSDRAANPKVLFVATPRPYFIVALYKIDSCASRLRNFLLTGTLLYTEITFEVPEHQSYIIYFLYICASVQYPQDQILYWIRHYHCYSPSFYQDRLCPTRTNSVSRVYSTVLFAIPCHYFT